VQDHDIERLAAAVTTVLNLEMACTEEMLGIGERLHPFQATLVPERREEITTEGGLDVGRATRELASGIRRLRDARIRVSLFIDPTAEATRMSHDLGADAVELHTGRYAHHPDDPDTLRALRDAAELGTSLGLAVHAGHGLTVRNVGPVAAVPQIEELNIGHSIVSRAIFVGIAEAVREMRRAMTSARAGASVDSRVSRF
jgi:pyridoxine 5-phosphate synthase